LTLRALTIQKSQQFRTWHKQLARKRTARPKLFALDKSVDAKIIHA
jgi:hypothetical protein